MGRSDEVFIAGPWRDDGGQATLKFFFWIALLDEDKESQIHVNK